MNSEIAARIFDELYDEDDLSELHKKKVIAQPIGFKLSTIAIIECELNAYHDRLTEENAKLREVLEKLVNPDNCKKDIIHVIGNAEQLLNQLKD